ncbi:hypothetical protein BSKO_03356 [Bryopsis sp. KO-2023]|nr:hypothetical protein BSKO_03356 [Bryopsis sp. KO-2023]
MEPNSSEPGTPQLRLRANVETGAVVEKNSSTPRVLPGVNPSAVTPSSDATSEDEEFGTPRESMSVCSTDYRPVLKEDFSKLGPKKPSIELKSVPSPAHPPGNSDRSDNPSLASMDVGSTSSMSREFDDSSGPGSSPFQHPVSTLKPINLDRSSFSAAAKKLKFEGLSMEGSNFNIARSLSGIAQEVLLKDGHESPLEDKVWRTRPKQFFIFSSAGKPIYSRYGDEGSLAGLMAIIQAMLSIIKGQGDTARSLVSGGTKVVFCSRGPLVLVGVSRVGETTEWIRRQLEYLYNQVLSLTTGALLRVLEKKPAQDVRNLLKGTGGLMSGLIRGFGLDPGYLVEAHCPLRMMPETRAQAANALHLAVKECHAKCGMLLCGGRLVSLVQDPWSPIHIQDMLLLQNFVLSNGLYREQAGAEFNAPICMPHLHPTAFLHAYIYYLEPGNPGVVVVLLMTQPDMFHEASGARKKMEQAIRSQGVIHTLRALELGPSFEGQIQISELPLAAGGGKDESSPIVYFMFRLHSKLCPQYVTSRLASSIENKESRQDLIRTVARVHSAMSENLSGSPNHEILWWLDSKYAVLAQVDPHYSLYLLCDPLTQKDAAVTISKELARYLRGQQVQEELYVSQKISA